MVVKLLIDVDLTPDELTQLQDSVKHRWYNHHVELKWFWPATQARSVVDQSVVTSIEVVP